MVVGAEQDRTWMLRVTPKRIYSVPANPLRDLVSAFDLDL